jgi:AraC-like DNA-binding protein
MNHPQATTNLVKMWTDPALEAVEFLQADYREMTFTPHVHEGFAIGVIEAGAQLFQPGRGARVLMPEGALCVINPWTVHGGTGVGARGWRYRMFYPPETLVTRAFGGNARPRTFDRNVIWDLNLYTAFLLLHFASEKSAPRLERETRILTFLREFFGRYAAPRLSGEGKECSRTAHVVRDYLHECFDLDVSVQDLSRITGVSETHVIRSFSKFTGMAPHAYLVGLRIDRAKRLIREGRSLADVAACVGFFDQSHLARHFKRTVGLTPGQYAFQISKRFL